MSEADPGATVVESSPLVLHATDRDGHTATMILDYDNVTHRVSGASLLRDQDCPWTRIVIEEYDPDGVTVLWAKTVPLGPGSSKLSRPQLNNAGITDLEDVSRYQVTPYL